MKKLPLPRAGAFFLVRPAWVFSSPSGGKYDAYTSFMLQLMNV